LKEWKLEYPRTYSQFVARWQQCWGSISNYEPMREAK
jgi:hypothetical protein